MRRQKRESHSETTCAESDWTLREAVSTWALRLFTGLSTVSLSLNDLPTSRQFRGSKFSLAERVATIGEPYDFVSIHHFAKTLVDR